MGERGGKGGEELGGGAGAGGTTGGMERGWGGEAWAGGEDQGGGGWGEEKGVGLRWLAIACWLHPSACEEKRLSAGPYILLSTLDIENYVTMLLVLVSARNLTRLVLRPNPPPVQNATTSLATPSCRSWHRPIVLCTKQMYMATLFEGGGGGAKLMTKAQK